jgi:glycosyltransferase involved in cell wall biosynthesis
VIYADQRWIGLHGIGRFAKHVLAGVDYRPVRISSKPSAPLDPWRLARALGGLGKTDLFFSPGYNSPLYGAYSFVFSVHDLSHIYCPENSSPLIRLYYATVLRRNCHRASRVLTVSEFTKSQLVQWAGLPDEKVVNVSCGVDAAYSPAGKRFAFPHPYVLCVSNRKRHKNELRIVDSFAKAKLPSEMRLVFTGGPTANIEGQVRANDLVGRVHFAGIVPEADLPSLYRGAVALLFPSLYEGFALPVLEAMACGTPVLTSKVTAMPETAGDAALLVDPTSVDEIAEATQRIVSDSQLRGELRDRGLIRAAQFSWSKTIERVRCALHVHSP